VIHVPTDSGIKIVSAALHLIVAPGSSRYRTDRVQPQFTEAIWQTKRATKVNFSMDTSSFILHIHWCCCSHSCIMMIPVPSVATRAFITPHEISIENPQASTQCHEAWSIELSV
jgi:hypothetical protein